LPSRSIRLPPAWLGEGQLAYRSDEQRIGHAGDQRKQEENPEHATQ
jgi:hypothetical protein